MDSAEVDARGTPEITSDDQPVVDSDAGAGTRAADDNTVRTCICVCSLRFCYLLVVIFLAGKKPQRQNPP